MTALLDIRALSKSFGGLHALRELSLQIRPGEIVGLIGPNGSGKTTTINLLTGVYRATSGRIMLGSDDVTAMGRAEIVKAGMARTFQNLRLFSTRSVLDNIRAGQTIHCRSWLTRVSAIPFAEERGLRREAEGLAERLQLTARLHHRAGDLSYGEKKRLEIARALATRPRLLLLDEPAAGMNPVELDWLIGAIRGIRESGTAILLVEHHMKLIMSVCDSISVLNFGSKISEGVPAFVARDPQVVTAYLGTSH